MITVKFWATIKADISDEDGKAIWRKIQHGKEVNFMILPNEAYVYGTTTVYVLVDVLRAFQGYPLQLNIR